MSSKLLINESPLQILPTLVEKVGLNEAIVLQQIQYWLAINEKSNKNDHFHDGRWWTYNTKKDWQRQFFWWSEATVKRILKSLREKGLLLATSEYNKKGYDRTLWYTIDYDKLNAFLSHSSGHRDPIKKVTMTQPIPETISKTINKDIVVKETEESLLCCFENTTKIFRPVDLLNPYQLTKWFKEIGKWIDMGITINDINAAVKEADQRGTTLSWPGSITSYLTSAVK